MSLFPKKVEYPFKDTCILSAFKDFFTNFKCKKVSNVALWKEQDEI